MIEFYTVVGVALTVIFLLCIEIARKDKLIQRQQDTIQRLVNREPVTYAETGAEPRKPIKESYAAWGNQMIHIDDDKRF